MINCLSWEKNSSKDRRRAWSEALYISLHLDEKTPHLHYQLENLNRETGRTVARTIKKPTLSKLQDIAGQVFSEIGLQRGQNREITGKRYKSVAEGHREELKQGEKKLQELKEEIQTYKDELNTLKNPPQNAGALLKNSLRH